MCQSPCAHLNVSCRSPARSQASSQLSEIADSLQQAEQDFDEDIRPSCLFSGGQDEGSYSSSPKDSPRAAEHSFGPHGPSPLAPTSAILRRFAGNADPASGADMDGGNAGKLRTQLLKAYAPVNNCRCSA